MRPSEEEVEVGPVQGAEEAGAALAAAGEAPVRVKAAVLRG